MIFFFSDLKNKDDFDLISVFMKPLRVGTECQPKSAIVGYVLVQSLFPVELHNDRAK